MYLVLKEVQAPLGRQAHQAKLEALVPQAHLVLQEELERQAHQAKQEAQV